ncbi:hypothetical protein FNF27_05402 [Cafeteria roenbergensis]|uniref:Uncharacterized protein n=1 Tax=Cafeteria roenbergensis TaxID=33653 RepID=A0A5A8E5K2_CAFRO|nr:hypothetical protein FNF27_05402 [Cafeteria roenbergensis]
MSTPAMDEKLARCLSFTSRATAPRPARENDGATALVWAASEGHTDTVELLLDCGADPEAKDRYGATALVRAAWRGHTDTVELLLDCGADPEAKDRYGRTAPVWAASEGHTDTVELLLDRGADLEATNNTGKNALALCTSGACAEVLRSAERLQRWHRRRHLTLWACTLGMIEI